MRVGDLASHLQEVRRTQPPLDFADRLGPHLDVQLHLEPLGRGQLARLEQHRFFSATLPMSCNAELMPIKRTKPGVITRL